MNWSDPGGPWQERMRAQSRIPRLLAGVAVVAAALMIAVPYALGRFTSLEFAVSPFVGTLLGAAAGGVVAWAWWSSRRAALVHRLVPEMDGRLCPRCVFRSRGDTLAVQEADAASSGPGEQFICEECGLTATTGQIALYWETWPFRSDARSPRLWRRVLAECAAGQTHEHDLSRLMRASSRWIFPVTVGMVALYAWMATTMMRDGNAGLFAALIASGQHLLLWAGLALVMFFGGRAVDTADRFCTKCRYQRAIGPDGEDLSGPRCPECGEDWRAPGGTTRGRIAARPAAFVVGGMLMVLPLAAGFAGFHAPRFAPRITPTPLLITEVVNKRGFNNDEWAQLNRRTLTTAQKLRLTEGLLDKRLERGGVIMDDAGWLAASLGQDWMSGELRERFWSEMFEPVLDAPAAARVGESFTVTLGGVDRNSFITDPVATVVVAGFRVGDDPEPRRRPDRAIQAIGIASGLGPQISITPDRAGPLHIRLDYWLLAIPAPAAAVPAPGAAVPNPYFLVEWTAEGEPILPPYVQWRQHRTVETTVVVE